MRVTRIFAVRITSSATALMAAIPRAVSPAGVRSPSALRYAGSSQRRFTVKLLGMDAIAAAADDHASLISLDPVGRKGEDFEGRFDSGPGFALFPVPPTLGIPAGFRVRVVVAADDRSMDLVVERRTADKRAFTARHAAGESLAR